MRNSTIIKNLKMTELIQDIDTKHEYTVRYFGHCELSKESILNVISNQYTPENDIHHVCYHKVNRLSQNATFQQLVYEYGGIPFNEYVQNVHHKAFHTAFKILFAGCKRLMEHGVFINDIKADNITYNLKKNRLLLIDFGGAKFVDPASAMYLYYYKQNLSALNSLYNRTVQEMTLRPKTISSTVRSLARGKSGRPPPYPLKCFAEP